MMQLTKAKVAPVLSDNEGIDLNLENVPWQLYLQLAGSLQFGRDVQSAFTIVTRLRATAVIATLCGLPAARSRSAKGSGQDYDGAPRVRLGT